MMESMVEFAVIMAMSPKRSLLVFDILFVMAKDATSAVFKIKRTPSTTACMLKKQIWSG